MQSTRNFGLCSQLRCQHDYALANAAAALSVCRYSNVFESLRSSFPDRLATASKNQLKVSQKPVGDFLGCVNLSKLRKQGNLA